MFSGGNPCINHLLSKASSRIRHALSHSTSRAYSSMFRVFVAFCVFNTMDLSSTSTQTILAFLEFLVFNGVSNTSNYLSAIKTKFSMFGLSVLPFLDPRIKYFNRLLANSAPFKVKLKAIIDPHTLQKSTKKCDSMYMAQVYKVAFLLSFFSFLCISNLVPHATTKFNQMEQLARGDVFFAPPGAHILIKWSKTLQTRDSVKIIKIPSLGSSRLCPVKALHTLLAVTPGNRNKPLFQIKKSTK